jgi:hypothetical protein
VDASGLFQLYRGHRAPMHSGYSSPKKVQDFSDFRISLHFFKMGNNFLKQMVGTSSFQLLSKTRARVGGDLLREIHFERICWTIVEPLLNHCWTIVEPLLNQTIQKSSNIRTFELDLVGLTKIFQVLSPRPRSPWCFACGCTGCNTGAALPLLCH